MSNVLDFSRSVVAIGVKRNGDIHYMDELPMHALEGLNRAGRIVSLNGLELGEQAMWCLVDRIVKLRRILGDRLFFDHPSFSTPDVPLSARLVEIPEDVARQASKIARTLGFHAEVEPCDSPLSDWCTIMELRVDFASLGTISPINDG